MKIQTRFIAKLILVASLVVSALAPTTVFADHEVEKFEGRPVRSYKAGNRVLKELLHKCPNGKVVAAQSTRKRCSAIVHYLNYVHNDPNKSAEENERLSSRTRCTIQLTYGAGNNKVRLGTDEALLQCQLNIDALNTKKPGSGIGQGSSDNNCGEVETFFVFDCGNANNSSGGNQNQIVQLGLNIISWMTGLVSLVVVGGIIYGAFLNISARDNAGQAEKGIVVITNSVIAIILWIFAYVLINFLVPGGLFHGP